MYSLIRKLAMSLEAFGQNNSLTILASLVNSLEPGLTYLSHAFTFLMLSVTPDYFVFSRFAGSITHLGTSSLHYTLDEPHILQNPY